MGYMDDDDYSLDDYPCFGTYEIDQDGCHLSRCKFSTACKAETRATSRRNRDYDRRIAMRPKVAVPTNKQAIQPQLQQQRGIQTVFHTDFTPYEGESIPKRVAKNVLLDIGVTTASSLANFLATFDWKPKPYTPPPLRVVEQVDSEDDDV